MNNWKLAKPHGRWRLMHLRCYDPSNEQFKHYGARGIKVCERWHDFHAYHADVGEPPFPHASLDRIDNDGDYKPGNVRWATKAEQARNRRSTRWMWVRGERMCMWDAAKACGISYTTLKLWAAV